MEAGQSQRAGTEFASVQVEAEVFTAVEPDAEFNTNAVRDRTCVSPEDGDIWSLSSPQEPAVAHNVDYSYQLLLNRHTLHRVICAGKIIPNPFFL